MPLVAAPEAAKPYLRMSEVSYYANVIGVKLKLIEWNNDNTQYKWLMAAIVSLWAFCKHRQVSLTINW